MTDAASRPLDPALLASTDAAARDGFDEVRDGEGRVRPHWRGFLAHLEALGAAELDRRWAKAQHLLHDHGVSYNVYGASHGLDRPWSLSPLPVLVSPEDWSEIARGMSQRARLLAALLADVYGPQRTLREGGLPPEIVFAHPSFLRPVHGIALPAGQWLPFYAADLVRGSEGRFHVLEDCTQAPSGAGYALENRIVVSRLLPESFRESNVERLAPFFRALRETLAALAPHDRDNPRIVLLTPGPYSATYFEHAFLAQYLGFTLAHGADLTVRSGRVFLKMLGGLQSVDVILRRVNDDFCDPLELRPESVLGVPGLVHAARMGNVAIASPLGSGLAQTPALLPYLPGLSRQLLGEELAMPSVPTWWCGDPAALEEVASRIDDLVIKPTFPGSDARPIFTASLSRGERGELVEKIRARPSAYVAQEPMAPSRALVLRCYAAASRAHDYTIMPGGLARAAGRSQDAWVLSHEPVSELTLLQPSHQALELSRGGGDLPSRVADDLFWLGRYAERADGGARLARVVGSLFPDLATDGDLRHATELGVLLSALEAQAASLATLEGPAESPPGLAAFEASLVSAACDPDRPGSIVAVLRSILRLARVVRDRISMDTWRVLTSLEGELGSVEQVERPDRIATLVSILNRIVMTLAGFSGLVMESMTRGQGWRFLDMGRRLERALAIVTLLRATTTRAIDREGPLLEAVLDVADSGMTYRRRYLATLQTAPVVDLLLTDDTNPRSVLYQVRALAEDIRALPPLPGAGVGHPLLRGVLAMLRELELADVAAVCAPGTDGSRPALEALLERIAALIPVLNGALSHGYLTHAVISRQFDQRIDPRERS